MKVFKRDIRSLLKRPIENVVILTGAGISAESGIKTFRDHNGLWENHDVTEVASPEGFAKNPALVHRFYNARRAQLFEVEPNLAHKALANAQEQFKNFDIITQNVDDLHERAGSKNVHHMHGELRRIRNLKTDESIVFHGEILPKDFNQVRPDIVWFGEMIKYAEEIQALASQCDLFVCIGTSNNVYPAAGIVQLAKENDALCVELNLETTALSEYYDISIQGPASKAVQDFFDDLIDLKE